MKPSEHSPAASKLLSELIPDYLDQSAYRVVLGGVEEATTLLELQWDFSESGRCIFTAPPVTDRLGQQYSTLEAPGSARSLLRRPPSTSHHVLSNSAAVKMLNHSGCWVVNDFLVIGQLSSG